MKVGIVTFFNAYNCGAFLQAYALQKKICQMGAEACLIDQGATIGRYGVNGFVGRGFGYVKYILQCINEFFPRRLRRKRYDACIANHMKVLKAVNGNVDVDCLIAGSDQVWNPGLVGNHLDAYLLEKFVNHKNKNSYGASFGVREIPEKLAPVYKNAISKFEKISVREEVGVSIIKDLSGKAATVVLDPTLLLDAQDYDEVSAERLVNGRYLCAYSVGDDPLFRAAARLFAKKMGMKLVYIQNGRMGLWGGRVSDWRVTSPDRFLSLIQHSVCVVTNSFHGTIFSVLYHKPFMSLVRSSSKVSSRFETLLKGLGLNDHLLEFGSKLDDVDVSKFNWEVEAVMGRVMALRKTSLEFLRSIIGITES